MTKAMVSIYHATHGGIYYSDDIDFTNPAVQPTWSLMSTTGLSELLIKVAQFDPVDPYNIIYASLNNRDIYRFDGVSWTKIMDEATAQTLSGYARGDLGPLAADKTLPGYVYCVIINYTLDGGKQKLIYSHDYGATWSVSAAYGSGLNTGIGYASAANGIVHICATFTYRSLYKSSDGGTTVPGFYGIWGSGGGGDHINVDPLNPNNCYYYTSATNFNLSLFNVDPDSETLLQNGKELGRVYALPGGLDAAGGHWFDPLVSNHQRIIVPSSKTFWSTDDGWTTINEGSPTAWSGLLASPNNLAAALENDDYILIGCGNISDTITARVYATVGENTGDAPWHVSGTNHATPPYTDAIPSDETMVSTFGLFVGDAPSSTGVYVYADEQGDITDIPDYDGLGAPLFGDRASWRDRNTDGFDIYHAEDVERDEREIHTPQPSGNDGWGIIETGGFWVNSGEPIALDSDLHDPVTLDADAAVILDLTGQEIGLDVQNANTVLAGPTAAPANEPTFRALVLADLPAIDLDDLADVDTAGVADGNALVYDSGTSTWIADDVTIDTSTLHEHIINEDHTDEVDGLEDEFATEFEFRSGSTAVYLNGIRQRLDTDYTEDGTLDGITFATAPEADDVLIIDYIISFDDYQAILLDSESVMLVDTDGEDLVDSTYS